MNHGLAKPERLSRILSIFLRELIGVWKLFQDRIVPRRFEKFQRHGKNRVQPGARVSHVKIERPELMTEMQFRIVIERTADVGAQLLLDRPANHVAHCVKIKVEIERDGVIEPEALIVNCVATDQAKTERHDFSFDSPNKKARPFRHLVCNAENEFFAQIFKLHRRTFVDLKIERKNLIDDRRNIADDLHVDLCRALCLPKLPAETFAAGVAERSQILVEVLKRKSDSRHRHARYPRVTEPGKNR